MLGRERKAARLGRRLLSASMRNQQMLTWLAVQVEHDRDGHDEEDASDLVRFRGRVFVVRVGEVVSVERRSGQDLVPAFSETLHLSLTSN